MYTIYVPYLTISKLFAYNSPSIYRINHHITSLKLIQSRIRFWIDPKTIKFNILTQHCIFDLYSRNKIKLKTNILYLLKLIEMCFFKLLLFNSVTTYICLTPTLQPIKTIPPIVQSVYIISMHFFKSIYVIRCYHIRHIHICIYRH